MDKELEDLLKNEERYLDEIRHYEETLRDNPARLFHEPVQMRLRAKIEKTHQETVGVRSSLFSEIPAKRDMYGQPVPGSGREPVFTLEHCRILARKLTQRRGYHITADEVRLKFEEGLDPDCSFNALSAIKAELEGKTARVLEDEKEETLAQSLSKLSDDEFHSLY